MSVNDALANELDQFIRQREEARHLKIVLRFLSSELAGRGVATSVESNASFYAKRSRWQLFGFRDLPCHNFKLPSLTAAVTSIGSSLPNVLCTL